MNKPEITDEEINAMMDFSQVLEKHKNANSVNRIAYLSASIGAAVVIGLLFYQSSRTQTESLPQSPPLSSFLKPRQEPTKGSDSIQERKSVITELPQTPKPLKKTAKIKAYDQQQVNAKLEVYIPAEPIEGYPHLYEYLNRNLNYPIEAAKDSIEGVESMTFIIRPDGKVDQIAITNSLGPLFDAEATRLLTNMPAWKAAILNGKPVASKMSIPLTFKIESPKK